MSATRGALFVVLVASLAALLAWTAFGAAEIPRFVGQEGDYFNLLARGFLKGRSAVDLEVPAALKAIERPWDPANRPEDLVVPADISYYNGRFFLYFGPAPVLTLLAPFRLLTGIDLPFPIALVGFCVGAVLLLSALWWRILRDHYPRAGILALAGGIVALGTGGALLILARRASFWELPIAAGQCFLAGMLLAVYESIRTRRFSWLAVAGTFAALAAASRPTLLLAAVALVVPIAFFLRPPGGGPRRDWRAGIGAALWAGVPLLVCGLGLLAYNHARFGDVREFGMNYQLTSRYEAEARHFSLSYVGFNARMYFWQPPAVDRYFPFLGQGIAPLQPAGYYSCEFVFAALFLNPLLWGVAFCAATPFRRAAGGAQLSGLVLATGLMAAAITAILLCFDTATSRYSADFLPWWTLLGLIGVVQLRDLAWDFRPARYAIGAAGGAAVIATAVFAFCASARLHGIFKFRNPAAFTAIGRVANAPVAWWEARTHQVHGPVELDIVFSAEPRYDQEPIVVTGTSPAFGESLSVIYQDSNQVVFEYQAGEDPARRSPGFTFVPGESYHLRLEAGSLLPPVEHPLFSGMGPVEIASAKGWLRLTIDGATIFDEPVRAIDASPSTFAVGYDQRSGRDRRFSGLLRRVHRVPPPPAVPSTAVTNDIALTINLPKESWPEPFRLPVVLRDLPHPLLVAGEAGKADLLGLRMRADGTASLVYERWGAGLVEGPPLAVRAGDRAEFRLRLGSTLDIPATSPLAVLRETVAVWVNGEPAWWMHSAPPLDPLAVPATLAQNRIRSNSAARSFAGRIADWHQLAPPGPWRAGPMAGVTLVIAGTGSGGEPLVATGVSGKANTLAIKWVGPARARLVYDHWSFAATDGPEFDWPAGRPHTIRVVMPSLAVLDRDVGAVGRGPLKVSVDGRLIWETDVDFYHAASATVAVARNPLGASVAGPALTAVVLDISQEMMPGAPP